MNKKKKILLCCIMALVIALSVGGFALADGEYIIKSHGRIVFNNDTEDTSDDVVFDANDIVEITNVIESGKEKIANALNGVNGGKLPNKSPLEKTSTFDMFETAINEMTIVPDDMFFYDKTTVSSSIERYVKIGDDYFSCDEHGQIIDSNPADVIIDNLVAYRGANRDSLSCGNSGYINGELCLGEAADAETLIMDLLNKTFTASVSFNGKSTSTVKMAKGTTTYSPSVTRTICSENGGSYDTSLQYASAPVLTIKGANAFSCTWYLKVQNYAHETDEDGLGDYYRAQGGWMDAGTVTVTYNNGTVTCSKNTKPTSWAWGTMNWNVSGYSASIK